MSFLPASVPVRGESRSFQRVRKYEKSEDLYLGKACDLGHTADTFSGTTELDWRGGYQPYGETFPSTK
jgi:hypothetical protein